MATRTMWRCRLRDSRGATNSVPVSPATQLRARVHPAIPTIRHQDPCKGVRHWSLLGFTTWECSICARILISIAVGTVIGCAFARPRPRRAPPARLLSSPPPALPAAAARAALATPAGGSARSAATRRQACAPCRYCVSAPAATASARSSPFSTAPWRGTPPDPRPLSRLESASSVPQNPAARPTAHRTFTRRARPAHDASVA